MANAKPTARGRGAFLRMLYPLPGAALGAAAGFHLYFLRPGLNTDSAAPALFAAGWAVCAMMAGAVFSGLAGWSMERALRRSVSAAGTWIPCGLALLSVAVLCRLAYAPLLSGAPALLWSPRPTEPAIPQGSSGPTCAEEPPPASAERRSWEQECR